MTSRSLAGVLSSDELLTREADLAAYSYDGALDRGRPDAVALPKDAEAVRRAVLWCAGSRTPFVARGAGTNLSGGCVPVKGGLVLGLARMSRILSIDSAVGAAVVEPGVVNLRLQEELAPLGRFYAPDPASYRICTIGGNVAENAGGPRCLKYGVTTNHVLAAEAVMPDGSQARFSLDDPGPDLLGLLVGAEGTLGVVTKVWLKTLPAPETIATILAGFPSVESSVECVAEIVASGILPRVLEAMDRTTVESIEAYCRAGYPRTGSVLLIELDGPPGQVGEETAAVERLCRRHGCSEYRLALDLVQRERLWEGRRGAYAAVARIAPNVLVEDGVVPRGALPEAYRRIRRVAERERIQVAMLFHAGDGNLHPNIAFDERDPDQTRRVKAAGFEILKDCVALGGSLSGEHGIGRDKRAAMSWLLTPETLSLMRRIKAAFDPEDIANPDKVLPGPGDPPEGFSAPRREPSAAARELTLRMGKAAADRAQVRVEGAGSRAPGRAGGPAAVTLSTLELTALLDLDRANYTVTVEAGIEPGALRRKLAAEGLHAPIPETGGTLGGLIASKACPRLRDHVLGMRLLLADGTVADLGGKVVKNVAGYDVPKTLFGSWGALAVILEVTLRLQPRPLDARLEAPRPFAPNGWHRRLKSAFDPENRLNPWVFA